MAKAKKLKSGNWRVQVYCGKDASGKKVMKSFTAPSKKEAEYLASQFLMELDGADLNGTEATVKAAIESYIANRESVLSPSTIRSYRQMQAIHYKSIENYRISRLNSEDVQTFINALAVRYSPKSVRNIYGLLISSIHAARPNKTITVTLPAKQIIERDIPTEEQVKTLLEHSDRKMRIAIMLASIGTLRRGEICALTYKDIDGNIVHVHSDMVHSPNGGWIHKSIPKTSSSDRYIQFPDKVIEELGDGEPDEYVIKWCPDTLTKRFIDLRDSCSMSCRFHDLRHYAASVMHSIGIPDQYIMERGGWSSDVTLKSVYRNVLDDKRTEFESKANKYMEKLL